MTGQQNGRNKCFTMTYTDATRN